MTTYYFDDYADTRRPYDWAKDEKPTYSGLLFFGALLILALQGVDWATTHALLERGYQELNPLAAALIAVGWLLAIKAALAAYLAWRVRRRPHYPLALLVAIYTCAGAYLTVALGNIFGLIH